MNEDTRLIEDSNRGITIIDEPRRRRLIVSYPDELRDRIVEIIEELTSAPKDTSDVQ